MKANWALSGLAKSTALNATSKTGSLTFLAKTWTRKGLVDVYLLLFFIHIDSRRVFVSGITANPTGAQGKWGKSTGARGVAKFTRDRRLNSGSGR